MPHPDAGDDDNAETAAVDPDAAAQTELAGVADAPTQSVYAWGQADDALDSFNGDGRRYWPGWITAAAIAASAAVITAAAVVAWSHLRSRTEEASPAPANTTTTSSAATTASSSDPPPATVTTVIVQPPPAQTVTQPVPPAYDAFDEQFVNILQRAGWSQDSPVFLARRGRQVCSMLQSGATPEYVTQRIVTDSKLPRDQAELFTNTAMSVYPNCP